MAQSQSPEGESEREEISIVDVEEGDRVFMGIQLHGLTDDVPGTEYDKDLYRSGVEGEVTEGLSEGEKAWLQRDDRGPPMADVTVTTDEGRKFTWNVDNGYVMGYHTDHDRVTDVGKIAGFYTA